MGFSKISADADFGGGVWHIIPSGEHREWTPLDVKQNNVTTKFNAKILCRHPPGDHISSHYNNGCSHPSHNGEHGNLQQEVVRGAAICLIIISGNESSIRIKSGTMYGGGRVTDPHVPSNGGRATDPPSSFFSLPAGHAK